jgi:hypothetical protein
MSRVIGTDKFIKNCIDKRGNEYDYSLVEYKTSKTNIKIICREHGIFEQTPNNHLSKMHKCPKCSIKYKNTNDFIKESIKLYGNKYDYSLVEYKNALSKVNIICKVHGIFEQRASSHLQGNGCIKCFTISSRLNINDFVNRSNIIHINNYDYSLVEYINNRTKVKIICKEHGIFEQKPNNHLNGNGCPICKESKGERIIRNFLINNNIKYIQEHTFNDCKFKFKLPFDFYIPKLKLCIEFNGEQHYKSFKYFGGNKGFELRLKRDKIKNDYCVNNNLKLLNIKFDENIENKLIECLNI